MSASQSRAADWTSVSSTVCRSKVERLMTLSTSAVAVCCWSNRESSRVRACTSSNSRTFSIAITAWSAKVFKISICRFGNNPASARAIAKDPTGTPSRNIGMPMPLRYPHTAANSPRAYSGSRDIRDLHDTLLKYRARRYAFPTWRLGIRASVDLNRLRADAVMGHEVEELAVEPIDKTELSRAEP